MRHPWRLTVPGRATRHPPAWFPVWRLGGQGNLSVPGHAGSAPLDRRPAWVDPRHAWMLQVPGPAPATHGVALPPFRRVGNGGSACPAPKARPTWVRAGLLRGFPRWLFGLGCSPAHQPSVYGMAWVGWRDRKAPWMAHYEPPWTGSRRVPRPHPRRPASGYPKMWLRLRLRLPLRLPLRRWPQLQLPHAPPPQPAEHPPRYTQAIASPPGPFKPCNINGLKGKSAP